MPGTTTGNSGRAPTQFYTRREGQNREVNQGQRVVLDLVSRLEKSGRSVTCDKFLRASVWLKNLLNVKWLFLEQYAKTKENYQQSWRRQEADRKTLLSSHFKIVQDLFPIALRRVELSSCSVVSMTLQKLTTQKKPNPEWFLIIIRRKPEWTQRTRWSERTQAREWPADGRWFFFYNLLALAVSALNAFIIWVHLNPNWINGISYKRTIFLTELGKQLVKDNAARRAVKSRISSSPSPAGTNTSSIAGKKRGCCVLCPRSKDVKHNITCSECLAFICKDHLACYNCQNNWS